MTNYTNLVVCVNYNNAKETMQFLKNIQQQNDETSICMIIVENSDSEQERNHLVEMIEKENYHHVYLVQASENLGYLNGMFYGVQYYKENINTTLPKWTTFCNTDIEIHDADFFKKITATEYDAKVWCLAPSVYSTTTQSYQNPHYKSRIPKQKINRIIQITRSGFLFGIYTWLADFKAKERKKQKEQSQYVYAAHGSFFIVHRSFLDSFNELIYPAFLYSEEAFIAENIRRNDKHVYYDANLEVMHYEHSTTHLLGNSRRARYIHDSLKYIRDTFY